MGSFDDIEREMLESIDVEAIERSFGIVEKCDKVTSLTKTDKPVEQMKVTVIKTAAESTRCKWTGKVQFDTAPEAIEALRRWRLRDRDVCWDAPRLRIYRCKKCHKHHMGKE